MTNRYQEAGVDITLGNAFVDRIKPLIRKTFTPGVITDIGGFGGCFDWRPLLFEGRYWYLPPMAWAPN